MDIKNLTDFLIEQNFSDIEKSTSTLFYLKKYDDEDFYINFFIKVTPKDSSIKIDFEICYPNFEKGDDDVYNGCLSFNNTKEAIYFLDSFIKKPTEYFVNRNMMYGKFYNYMDDE